MKRVWMTAVAVALMGTTALAQSTELLADNPALAALNDRDPATMAEVLKEMDRLSALPQKRGLLVPNSDSPEDFDLLKLNPALADLHRRDPKATAKLLTIIRPQR